MFYPSAEIQPVNSTIPADWAFDFTGFKFFQNVSPLLILRMVTKKKKKKQKTKKQKKRNKKKQNKRSKWVVFNYVLIISSFVINMTFFFSESLCVVEADMLGCNILVTEFEPQSLSN